MDPTSPPLHGGNISDEPKKASDSLRDRPMFKEGDSAESAGRVAAAIEEGMDPAEKVNILIVDDDPGKLLAHETILGDLNQNVIRAQSGLQGLELLLKMEFAVILLDVNMPDIDGFEVASLIRQRPRFERIPIIFITGYNTTDIDRLKGYGIGAVDYLFLPVVPEVLKAKVQVFVELAKQNRIMRKQAEDLAVHNHRQQEQIRTIRELNQKLETANQELESFSYSVSHDLRNPLRAIAGYSQILLNDFSAKLNPECQDFLRRINKAALRMDALTRDILAYTQVSKIEVQTEPVDLEPLFDDLIRESQALRPSGALITVKKPLHRVLGHVACLTQCLSNLLDNASKFVLEKKVPEITIRTERLDDRVRIWVEDNGVGIDPSLHERIFKMFERGETGWKYEGTGIGLTIVKKAAERMNGSVGLESQVGLGSRFWIELPAIEK